MTDYTPQAPITVNAKPGRDQAEALFRTAVVSLGSVAAAFGAAKAAGLLSLIAANATPIVTAVASVAALTAFVWGQVKTRVLSKKAAALAAQLPDSVATTK